MDGVVSTARRSPEQCSTGSILNPGCREEGSVARRLRRHCLRLVRTATDSVCFVVASCANSHNTVIPDQLQLLPAEKQQLGLRSPRITVLGRTLLRTCFIASTGRGRCEAEIALQKRVRNALFRLLHPYGYSASYQGFLRNISRALAPVSV